MSGTIQASIVKDSASSTSNLALDSSGNVTVGNNLTVSGTGNQSFSGNLLIGTASNAAGNKVVSVGGGIQLSGGTTAQAGLRIQYASSVATISGINNDNNAYNPIAFLASGTEAMRIDTSGNVGIGVTSPASKLHIYVNGSQDTLFSYGANPDNYISTGASGITVFRAATTERMRIDSSGNLLVGTTSTYNSATHSFGNSGISVLTLRNTSSAAGRYWFTGPDSNANYIVYNNNLAGVYLTYGNTSWTASSDERLKTDLVPITNAANKVNTLRAVTGRYKTDEVGKSRSFLIAQDVQKVLPEAVHVGDDEQQTLGLAYTDVIPLLVAALQEAVAKIDALETRIAKLESK